ncbi:hypothetical protein ONE63_006438 [Megalurothrips usitatus]|uniref:Sulfatase N-terminal domain-containing protein n=1 Tax=Megalurothrips usitatus TaxID=439358 RepID=A0AAV7XTF0_9NEOP|nr:hypothetical protein ONE63_006438 [Megalurothrips usitatus]
MRNWFYHTTKNGSKLFGNPENASRRCQPPTLRSVRQGWNDLSFHGSDEIPTPNIDALAYNGAILNQHYVQPVCTPSRAALLTGRYPAHMGMQGPPILAAEPRALPLGHTLLPEYLQTLGYVTHGIGKWHLGYHRTAYLPTRRGFDTFLGYYNGALSYYDHILEATYPDYGYMAGHDMRRNESVAWDLQGRYATDVFTEEAVDIIRRHDQRVPLFMYLSHLAVHAGNAGKLLEAPQEEIDKFRHIADPNRRTYAAMVSKLDESVGSVVAALQARGMLESSIILFMSDNGAPTIGNPYPNWGSNAPHRGLKETLWEGGVKGAAVLWSPLLNRRPRVSFDLLHVTDWLPTLYSAAGGRPYDLPPDLDGVDQWTSLANDLPSRRSEILINIDERARNAAVRQNNWKLVIGTVNEGKFDGYLGSAGSPTDPPFNYSAVLTSPAGRALTSHGARSGWPVSREYGMAGLRARATVRCGPSYVSTPCDPAPTANKLCLYDVQNDPCEKNNLADIYPSVARALKRTLVRYRAGLVPQPNTPNEPALADPKLFGGAWSPWHDRDGAVSGSLQQPAPAEEEAGPPADSPPTTTTKAPKATKGKGGKPAAAAAAAAAPATSTKAEAADENSPPATATDAEDQAEKEPADDAALY